MRIRPLAALSIAALSAVLLTGCAGSASPDAASPTGTPGDLCAAAAPSGAASDAVTVDGEAGQESTATFSAPLEIPELQRTVVSDGSGDPIQAGDYINYALSAFDAQTGDLLGTVGYNQGEGLPQTVSPDSPLGQIFGCATTGTRVVVTFPKSDAGNAIVYIVDLLGVNPTAAWGEPQEPVAGMPTVALAADGAPTITMPTDLTAPDTTQLAVLKKGDGAVVQPGASVLVQYTGALLADGSVFDSSWDRGAPAQFETTGVVEGFKKALEGQTVGSQVLAVIPAAEGYADKAQEKIPAGSTLVFVVDILGAQNPAAQ